MEDTSTVSTLVRPSHVRFFSPSSAAHPDQGDTDSDVDVYNKNVPSTDSLPPPESSTPTYIDHNAREPYPAWSSERQIPLSKEEIEDIFLDLTQKFGFQRDSMRNMVCDCLLASFLFVFWRLPRAPGCFTFSSNIC